MSAYIPESVKIIGAEAFARCGKLREISLPGGIEDIGAAAFFGCAALAEKDGFVMIGDVCCGYIGDGSSITVPDKASAIAPGAFRENKRILFLTVPDTVELLYELRGAGCDLPLTAITVDECADAIARCFGKSAEEDN